MNGRAGFPDIVSSFVEKPLSRSTKKLKIVLSSGICWISNDAISVQDESESYVSHMWHRVALCSCEVLEQLTAFQRSIEALYSDETSWQKFEYLLELGSWMYSNEFPIEGEHSWSL